MSELDQYHSRQDHEHGHSHHDHAAVNYEDMYKQPWVQAMVKQIQNYLVANAGWIGIDPSKEQRVLDYACGHGTISLAILKASDKAICRGIDLEPSQVKRYNEEARKLSGNEMDGKMVAIQGNLFSPTSEMAGAEWQNFDLAVISMALHHVQDPVEMLRLLRHRLRPGGILVVVEFLGKQDAAEKQSHYDPSEMVEVVGKPKIWPGFTTGKLEADLNSAGFEGFDVKMLEEPTQIPESARGKNFDGEQWCFFAKAVVPA